MNELLRGVTNDSKSEKRGRKRTNERKKESKRRNRERGIETKYKQAIKSSILTFLFNGAIIKEVENRIELHERRTRVTKL